MKKLVLLSLAATTSLFPASSASTASTASTSNTDLVISSNIDRSIITPLATERLWQAVQKEDLDGICSAISAGADVNSIREGRTPLHTVIAKWDMRDRTRDVLNRIFMTFLNAGTRVDDRCIFTAITRGLRPGTWMWPQDDDYYDWSTLNDFFQYLIEASANPPSAERICNYIFAYRWSQRSFLLQKFGPERPAARQLGNQRIFLRPIEYREDACSFDLQAQEGYERRKWRKANFHEQFLILQNNLPANMVKDLITIINEYVGVRFCLGNPKGVNTINPATMEGWALASPDYSPEAGLWSFCKACCSHMKQGMKYCCRQNKQNKKAQIEQQETP